MRIDLSILALPLALLTGAAHAAAPAWPTQDAIGRARETHPFPDLERLNRALLPALPRITPGVPSLDIEDIARRHIQLKSALESQRESSALRIFVSLSMPEASLRLLVTQAERASATLVLRGLKANSMTQTLAAVQALIGERKVAWQIDPEAYARYGVQHAPTFVLTKDTLYTHTSTCGTNCAAPSTFYSVAGDVSLDYALATLVRRHPDAQRHAAPFQNRLRATP